MDDVMTHLPAHADAKDRRRCVATTHSQRGRLAAAARPPISFGLRLRGRLHESAIAAVLTGIARRHTALRTHFPPSTCGDHGHCAHPDDVRWEPETIDVRGLRPEERAATEASIFRGLHQPFEPHEFPLFRAVLLRDTAEWVLAVAIDHLVFDAASVPVILRDVERLYPMATAGATIDGRGGSDFAEFSRQERDWLDGPRAGEAMAYWAEVWRDFGPFPVVDLPAPRPDGTPPSIAVWRARLAGAPIRQRLRGLVPGHLSLACLAAASAVAALRDLGLLYPSSRRFLPGGDAMVGYLTNRVLLRTETRPAMDFDRLVAQTRAATIRGLQHSLMPFELLVSQLTPRADARRPDRPYVHLNVAERPRPPALPGLTASYYLPPRVDADAYLSWIFIDVEDDGNHVGVTTTYHRAHIDDDVISELMTSMSTYLAGDHPLPSAIRTATGSIANDETTQAPSLSI
jgi:hypothetical protein